MWILCFIFIFIFFGGGLIIIIIHLKQNATKYYIIILHCQIKIPRAVRFWRKLFFFIINLLILIIIIIIIT